MKRVLFAICVIVGWLFCASTASANNGLPTLYITLNNTSYEIIAAGTKDTKYPDNHVDIIDTAGQSFSFDNVEVKGRGNSTWGAPKKPFQIKFNQKTEMFDLGASKKWVLLADYFDDSHLRNALTFHIASLLDMPYTNRGQFVDLYIDGQYYGVYYLCHKTEIGKSTVNLKNEYGILIEMDNIHEPDEEYVISDIGNHTFLAKDTVSDSEQVQHAALEDFRQAYNRFERALYANDYDAIKKEIDVQSFVDYFLTFEYSVNVDGISTSFYFYKDGPDDLIHAGPIWDFDFAYSNFRWRTNPDAPQRSPYRSWSQTIMRRAQEDSYYDSEIFLRLMDHQEFRNLVKQTFQNKIQPYYDEIDSFITDNGNYLRASATIDNRMWDRNPYDTSVGYIRDWSRNRLDYLDIIYGVNSTAVSGTYRIGSYSVALNQGIFTDDYYLQPQNDGSYKIIAVNTGYALSAESPHEVDSNVSFSRSLNIDAQHWYISHHENSQNYIINKNSGLFLTAEGDKLILQEYRYNEAQTFNLFYRMKTAIRTNGRAYYQIVSASNPNLIYQGNKLVARNALFTTSYQITKRFDSSYNIVNPLTGEQENWIVQESTAGQLRFIHPRRLTALSANGHELELTDISDAPEQSWELREERLPQLANPLIIIKP
jgi:hypothetical protein